MPRARVVLLCGAALYVCAVAPAIVTSAPSAGPLDRDLAAALSAAGFTGQIQQTYV